MKHAVDAAVTLSMKALETKRLHIKLLIGKAAHHAQSGNPTQEYSKTRYSKTRKTTKRRSHDTIVMCGRTLNANCVE